jgi:hypothetical protein
MAVSEEVLLALLLTSVLQELAIRPTGASGLTVSEQELMVGPASAGGLTISE